MRKATIILAAILILAMAIPIFAAAKTTSKTAPTCPAMGTMGTMSNTCPMMTKAAVAKKPAEIRCAVRGEIVKNPKTAPKSVYKGKTYYFCCPSCKPLFDKNPEKYIKKMPAKPAAKK